MTNILTYAAIGFVVFLVTYLWLQRMYILNSTSYNKSFFYDGLAEVFYFVFAIGFSLAFWYVKTDNFVAPLNSYSLFVPLLLSGVLLVYGKFAVLAAVSAVLAFFVPLEAVSNYISVPFYLNKLMVASFILSFSYFYGDKKSISGMSFLHVATLGFVFLGLSILRALPELYGLWGIVVGVLGSVIYWFNKFPAKIASTQKDFRFFGFVVAWLLLLGCAEFCFLPMFVVCAMLFANMLYQIFQKIWNLSFFRNYDAFNVAVNQGVDEHDLLSFMIKTYSIMGLLAVASIHGQGILSVVIMSLVLSSWFLYKAINLYQQNTSWSDIYKDIKKHIGSGKNDSSN